MTRSFVRPCQSWCCATGARGLSDCSTWSNDRCGGRFDDIDDVIPPEERDSFMARYKSAAGFAMEKLNAAPPTIAPGATVAA